MKSLKQVIKHISEDFIREATASPRMLEDLAAMEKYMSESYDGRTFIELLQNSDDAESTKIQVLTIDNTLIVANDGRPFNEKDIMAICRSGASEKQRGNSIGYRGVGFKSATSVSTEIIIHSADAFFTFSKKLCAKILGKDEQRVPTVRIPFLYDESNLTVEVVRAFEKLKKAGFTTFFIFLKPNIEKFTRELDGFDAGWLLFLKQLSDVNIDCGGINKKFTITRKKKTAEETILNIVGRNEQWYIISKNAISIAFRHDPVIGALPCGPDEGVFHCFLPTMDKTGFPFKVNADFSTDPSRKHIIKDKSTKVALENVQRLWADTVSRITHNKIEPLYPILELINSHTILNDLVSDFEAGLLEKLRQQAWVPLNNGQCAKPCNTKTLPKWLDISEKEEISSSKKDISSTIVSTDFIRKTDKIEMLLSKIGAIEVTIMELSDILTNFDSVRLIRNTTSGKLFAYYYRIASSDSKKLEQLYVPTENGYILLINTSNETPLNPEFIKTVKEILNAKESETLGIQFEVFSVMQKKKASLAMSLRGAKLQSGNMPDGLAINKWKTPVQNAMALEALQGCSVKDVSRKSSAYNIESRNSVGEVSYITVKTVAVLGDSFNLSESEYATAQRLGNAYKVYLFTTNTTTIEYTEVVDPVGNSHPKKVGMDLRLLSV